MTTPTTESTSASPFLERLNNEVKRGNLLLEKPAWEGGSVRMWFARVGKLLREIYGRGDEFVSLWPAGPELGKEQSRPIFVEHLAKLERFTSSLSESAKTSFSSEGKTIFIGHGRSPIWHQLNTFLSRQGLTCAEFNAQAVAGITTPNRLDEMLDAASFAFFVMTADDKHADGTYHPRHNVIHEIGLFQGRLGARRAIILREEGCEKFSNADGLTDIPFPHNDLEPIFHKVSQVLKREGLL